MVSELELTVLSHLSTEGADGVVQWEVADALEWDPSHTSRVVSTPSHLDGLLRLFSMRRFGPKRLCLTKCVEVPLFATFVANLVNTSPLEVQAT